MSWVNIKKLNGGSWWMREANLPEIMPSDWTVLEIKATPFEWWQTWGE